MSIEEARRLLSDNPGARPLAGGHSLLPLMKLRLANPEAVVDIGGIPELKGITATPEGFRIGAGTTHAAIAASKELREGCGILAETAARIGDPAVRNRGTIGGSIAHADPGADLPAVLVAADAAIEVTRGSGAAKIPAGDFFVGLMSTALAEAELVTAIHVPRLAQGQGAAYTKFPHPASRYAVIGAAAWVAVERGTCTRVRVVAGGLVPKPTRLASVEQALAGTRLDAAAIDAASGGAAADLGDDLIGDVFASAEYRRAVLATYVARALREAAGRAA